MTLDRGHDALTALHRLLRRFSDLSGRSTFALPPGTCLWATALRQCQYSGTVREQHYEWIKHSSVASLQSSAGFPAISWYDQAVTKGVCKVSSHA